jgi:chromosome segregation protein
LVGISGSRNAARDYLFDRVVFVETLEDAMALWHEQERTGADGATFVTRAGELVDAAGVVTGGQVSSSGGLLQRRREVMELEVRRTTLVAEVEQARQRRESLQAECPLSPKGCVRNSTAVGRSHSAY